MSRTYTPGIKHAEEAFTGFGSIQLLARSWQPKSESRAAVIIVHGYADHSRRYTHVAECFVRQGLSVFAYDQRGHGRSDGKRAFVKSFDEYIDDLGIFVDLIHARVHTRPLFIFGHSMGGLVSAAYCLQRAPVLQGLILSSPAIDVGQDVPIIVRKLARLISLLAPTLPTVKLDFDDISHDSTIVARAKQDPLQYHGRMPARLGAEIMRTAAFVSANADSLLLPILILHGTADRIADPNGSRELHRNTGSYDKTLHLYDDLYHETFNEPQKKTVLEDVSRWINERL